MDASNLLSQQEQQAAGNINQPTTVSALGRVKQLTSQVSMTDMRFVASTLASVAFGMITAANVSDSDRAQRAGKLAPNFLIAAFACLASANLKSPNIVTRLFSWASASSFLLAIVAYNILPAASVNTFEALAVIAFAGMGLSIIDSMKAEMPKATSQFRKGFLVIAGFIATASLAFSLYNWSRNKPENSKDMAISNDLIPLAFSLVITVVHSLITSNAKAQGHDWRHNAGRWLTGIALVSIFSTSIMTVIEDAGALPANVSIWMDVLLAGITALMGLGERLGFSPLKPSAPAIPALEKVLAVNNSPSAESAALDALLASQPVTMRSQRTASGDHALFDNTYTGVALKLPNSGLFAETGNTADASRLLHSAHSGLHDSSPAHTTAKATATASTESDQLRVSVRI